MNFISSFLLLLGAIPMASAGSKFVFTESSSPQCSGSWSISSFNLYCEEGGGYCTWGSEAEVSGIIEIASTFDSDDVTVHVEALSMFDIYDEKVDFCKKLTSEDGSSCPSAGTYSFQTSFPLPGNAEASYSNLYSYSIPIKAYFTTSSGQIAQCTASVKVQKHEYTMRATTVRYVGGAAFVFLGLSTIIGYRKRRVATINLQEEEKAATHFEMMSDFASV